MNIRFRVMDKRIKVSDDLRRKIAKTFGVTETTVRSALRYDPEKGFTETAGRIRVMALQNGGVVTVSLPECETIHDEKNGTMVQTFGNGATLTIDKITGNARVDYKGKTMLKKENIMVNQIDMLQEYAAAF